MFAGYQGGSVEYPIESNMSQELLIAVCLMLVFEGILPFLAPARWRQVMASIMAMPDRQIRIMGLISMVIGVVLLSILN